MSTSQEIESTSAADAMVAPVAETGLELDPIIQASDDEETPLEQPAAGSSGIRENVSTVADGLAFGLNAAKVITEFSFAFAKFATSTSINLAKAVVDSVGENSGLDATGITPVLSMGLTVADKISNAGIRVGEYFTNLGLDAASRSVDGVGNVFGNTEMSDAIREFAALVQRELERDLDEESEPLQLTEHEVDDSAVVRRDSENGRGKRTLNSIGFLEIIKSITAFICLQRMAIRSYEERALAACSPSLLEALANAQRLHHGDNDINLQVVNPEIEEIDDSNLVMDGTEADAVVLGHIGSESDSGNHSWGDINVLSTERLFQNVRRYIRFASGSYGKLAVTVQNRNAVSLDEHIRHNRATSSGEAVSTNHAFFSDYTARPLPTIYHTTYHNEKLGENRLLSNISAQKRILPENTYHYNPTFYLILDHPNKSVVLCLRGTLSLHDLMVDLSCEYAPITIDGSKYIVHSGMYNAATRVTLPADLWLARVNSTTSTQQQESGSPSTSLPNIFKTDPTPPYVHEAVLAGLQAHPGYNLIVTGHSLGAGIASLITLQWGNPSTGLVRPETGFPPQTRIHCFSYATPAILARLDRNSGSNSSIPQYASEFSTLVTNVKVGYDFVPNLSLGSVRDLSAVVAHMHATPHLASGLIARYVGKKASLGAWDGEAHALEVNDEILGKCSKSVKLFPVGRSFWVRKSGDGDGELDVREVERPDNGVFGGLVFGKDMLSDHLPVVYEDLIRAV